MIIEKKKKQRIKIKFLELKIYAFLRVKNVMKIINIYENVRTKDALLACERGQKVTRSFPLLTVADVAYLDTYCTLRTRNPKH